MIPGVWDIMKRLGRRNNEGEERWCGNIEQSGAFEK